MPGEAVRKISVISGKPMKQLKGPSDPFQETFRYRYPLWMGLWKEPYKKVTVEVKLSGKNTGGIGRAVCAFYTPFL